MAITIPFGALEYLFKTKLKTSLATIFLIIDITFLGFFIMFLGYFSFKKLNLLSDHFDIDAIN